MSAEAKALRRAIHARPDLSGQETETADRLQAHFRGLGFNNVIEALGGTGLAIIIDGREAGPTIMLRAELDALPIIEENPFAHRSINRGVAHKCGHDGHMAILAEVGQRLANEPLPRGRVVLLFQPAEETGRGALDILADPDFDGITPDRVYALHNLPDYPIGQVITRPGTFSCASRGMHISLRGLETHAAQPEKGISPSRALCHIVEFLEARGNRTDQNTELTFATVVHASMGVRSFGIAPGAADIMATLRSEHNASMTAMVQECESEIKAVCKREKLDCAIAFDDVFPATVNDHDAFTDICAAAQDNLLVASKPFRWSEDFGHFTSRFSGAMFGLGAGTDTPALHHPAYDFPDELIDIGADIFMRLMRGESSY